MRMRKKPNLLPRMERAAQVQITDPENYPGLWREKFPGYSAVHLELGCGKGRFTADTAEANPDVLLIAVERVRDAMVVGMERAVDRELTNIRFIDRDVTLLPSIFAPGEHRAEGGALPLLSVSNTDEKGFVSPEQAHRLFTDGEAGDDTAAMLTEKLENEGWGGLILDMEYLFPFDRAPYTAFVEKLEKAVHGAGRWLILALPAEAALRPHSRGGAAYDLAALSGLCERVIFTCDDVWTGESLERCVSALSGLMPAEKVILGLRDYGSVRRGEHETAIKSCAAHNLAVSAKARIYREGEGVPASFDFTDAAGGLCYVQYTDALWFYTMAEKIKSLGLAGIFFPAAGELCPGGKYLSDWLLQAEKLV